MDRSLPGPDGGQSQTERRLRHECEQLKLALAEATVQLRIWQKGSEFVDAVPSPAYLAVDHGDERVAVGRPAP